MIIEIEENFQYCNIANMIAITVNTVTIERFIDQKHLYQ